MSQIMPDECPPDGYTGDGSMIGVYIVVILIILFLIFTNKKINDGKG